MLKKISKYTKAELSRVTQADLAPLLGVSNPTISNWKDQQFDDFVGPFPQPASREKTHLLYDFHVVRSWWVKYQIFTQYKDLIAPSDQAEPGSGTLEQAKTRRANADASLAEIELAVAQGKLIPVKDVEAEWSDQVLKVRAKLLTIPKRVSKLLYDGLRSSEREEIIEREIRDTLTIMKSSDEG